MRCLRCRATLPNQTDPIAFRFAGDVEDRLAKSKRCRRGNIFNPADVSELKHDRPQCRSEPCGQHGRRGCSAQPSRPCRLTCEKSSSAAIFVPAARLSRCLVAARRTRVLVRLAWRWPLLPLWQRDWAAVPEAGDSSGVRAPGSDVGGTLRSHLEQHPSVAVVRQEPGRPVRHPGRGGGVGDLGEQLGAGVPTSDHDNVFADESGRVAVVHGVQLLTGECAGPRVDRQKGCCQVPVALMIRRARHPPAEVVTSSCAPSRTTEWIRTGRLTGN